jgi:hypothetical protein
VETSPYVESMMMKHRNSHFAVGYWSRLRSGQHAPDQADIDPRALRSLLPFVFILDARPPEEPVFRLAGTTLCQRYGAELRGRGFLSHWDAGSRARLAEVIPQALAEGAPACLTSIGATQECHMVEIETVLLPLTFGSNAPERFLGVAQVLTDVAELAGCPIGIERLVASSLIREGVPPMRAVQPPETINSRPQGRAPYLRLVANNTRGGGGPLRSDFNETLRRTQATNLSGEPAVRD